MERDPELARVRSALAAAARLAVVLDYDGTLVPLAPTPEMAAPDPELLPLLAGLATRPRTTVHVVSGRPRDVLARWLAPLPVWLWAEHGAWRRAPRRDVWEALVAVPAGWADEIWPLLQQATADTPGSLLERKSAAVAWHYRNVAPDVAARQLERLRRLLSAPASRGAFEIMEGSKVIEVRFPGVSKAIVGRYFSALQDDGLAVLAIGDDRTDDDLFAALPDSSIIVAVGTERARARCVLADYRAVRELLRMLVA